MSNYVVILYLLICTSNLYIAMYLLTNQRKYPRCHSYNEIHKAFSTESPNFPSNCLYFKIK